MEFENILSQFSLPKVLDVKPVGSGLINVTYKVTTENGDYVLQKLHSVIPDAAAEDMQVVTSFLATHGLYVPVLTLSNSGEPFVRSDDGSRWRVYPWIAGRVVDAVENEIMAHSAGSLIRDLHHLFSTLDYKPTGSIPHFHDTAFILEELREERGKLKEESLIAIADDILRTLPSVIISDGPTQIIHGDLKISNILFDDSDTAIGIIDFDTLLVHHTEIDLGDALRSWCNKTGEDDPRAVFDMGIFNAVADGYYAEGRTAETDARLLRGAKQIALELSARFLVDVVRDNYFGFDATKYATRRDANIARAIGQHRFATTIPLA